MNMILVQPWVAAVVGKLNLELQLTALHRQLAHGARRADTRPAPRAIRTSSRELAACDGRRAFSRRIFSSGI
jgi:hypothetical protein